MNRIRNLGQLGPVSYGHSTVGCGFQLDGHCQRRAFALVSIFRSNLGKKAGRNTFTPRKLAHCKVSIFDVLNEFLHV